MIALINAIWLFNVPTNPGIETGAGSTGASRKKHFCPVFDLNFAHWTGFDGHGEIPWF